MFKMNRIMGRYKRFFAAEKRIDTLLIMNTGSQDPNFYYLTGFKSSLFEKNILLISKNHAYLFTYDLEYQDAVRQKFPGMEVVRMGNTVRAMTLLLKEIKGKRIGINGEFLPFNYYEKLSKAYKPKTMIDVSESLANARLIKDKNEIENIRKAAKNLLYLPIIRFILNMHLVSRVSFHHPMICSYTHFHSLYQLCLPT